MKSHARDVEQLYESHARQVWRTLLRLGVSQAAVEDAMQDVFLTAHQRLTKFEGASKLSTWVIGIAVRVAANARRAQSRRGPLAAVDAELVDSRVWADEQLDQRRKLYELDQVLSRLPAEQREVLVLIDLEHVSAPEVAEALEVKLNTVYSRLRLARATLARVLTRAHQETA